MKNQALVLSLFLASGFNAFAGLSSICREAYATDAEILSLRVKNGEDLSGERLHIRMTPELMTRFQHSRSVIQVGQNMSFPMGQVVDVNETHAVLKTAEGLVDVRLGEYGGWVARVDTIQSYNDRLQKMKSELSPSNRDIVSSAQAASRAQALVRIQLVRRPFGVGKSVLTYIGRITSVDATQPVGSLYNHPEQLAIFMHVEKMTNASYNGEGERIFFEEAVEQGGRLVLGHTSYRAEESFRIDADDFTSIEILSPEQANSATVPLTKPSYLRTLRGMVEPLWKW